MQRHERHGELFINGQSVGNVVSESISEGWGFGRFTPSAAFSQFAPIFGAWAMMLHEDDDRDRTSPEARDELRTLETTLDQLKAELHWTEPEQHVIVRQLTIDGTMIEWNQ
jgi:hypothetical protein